MQNPKKTNINLIQEKKFSRMIDGLNHLPHNGIIDIIDSKLFSLDENRLYYYKPELLASEEYVRCLELFKRRLPEEYCLPTQQAYVKLQMQLQMINNVVFNKEMMHIEELKQIAVNTIRFLFDIPEHVNILPDIRIDLDVDTESQDDSLEPILSLTPERKKFLIEEIKKREILNGIVHGCAMHIWKSAYYIVKEKIDEIDPMLMEMYDRYTTSVGWLLWQMSIDYMQDIIADGNMITQGFCELNFKEIGKPDCDIHCHAINFPVLLHEITKGAIDYLISRGIPKGLTKEELKFYYAKADDYKNEIYHYLLSPSIWIKLVETVDVNTQHLPSVIMKLTQLSYEQLCEIFMSIIDDLEKGKEKLIKYQIITKTIK